MVSIIYDKDANAFYIKISDKKIVKTIPSGNDKFVDVDDRGEIVGFEVLNSALTITEELAEVIARTKAIEISA